MIWNKSRKKWLELKKARQKIWGRWNEALYIAMTCYMGHKKKKKLPTKFNTESDAVDATMMLSKADTLLENEKAVTIAVA